MPDIKTITTDPTQLPASSPKYSIEFFHIYTDETISPVHMRSMEYLKSVKSTWRINDRTIVLIDEYSPKNGTLRPEEVLKFLDSQNVKPDYWAYEGDIVPAAKLLLDNLTNKHLEKNYRRYIEKSGKYPCSLLTASWYLTRLGVFDTSFIKKYGAKDDYQVADRLINILPAGYEAVEMRAFELVAKSNFHAKSNVIQDLFYEADYDRELAVF